MILQSLPAAADYTGLFRITLPETILEVASLVILIADLGFLRNSTRAARMTTRLRPSASSRHCSQSSSSSPPRNTPASPPAPSSPPPLVAAAQIGILLLTAIVLLLSIKVEFTRNPGEFVTIVLLATTGMMLVTAARDLLIIFVALELLSLSLYVLTAFTKSLRHLRRSRPQVLPLRRHVGSLHALRLQLPLRHHRHYQPGVADSAALRRNATTHHRGAGTGCRRPGIQSSPPSPSTSGRRTPTRERPHLSPRSSPQAQK